MRFSSFHNDRDFHDFDVGNSTVASWRKTVHWLVVPAVLVPGLLSLRNVDLERVTDLGLVTALPLLFFVALGVLSISFCWLVHAKSPPQLLLFLHVAAFITLVHGAPSLIYEAPRYAWAYKHIGVTEYIQRLGSVNPYIDAYFNWPGFFSLSAFFTEVAGKESALAFAGWAPLFFNFIYVYALLFIFSAFTDDQRLIWLSVWFFCIANWVGQDYFSPQALGYFFHLVLLGLYLKWFGRKDTARKTSPVNTRPFQKVGLMAMIIILFGVTTATHQLTPFMTLASVAALVVSRRNRSPALPVLMVVVLTSWIIYPAAAYTEGHLPEMVASLGQLGSNYVSSTSERFTGSDERLFVLNVRTWLSSALWGLAFLGTIQRWRKGYWDISCALLAAAPFPMIFLQSYGGEMMLRIYLFSLPFMAFFVASLFYTSPTTGADHRTLGGTVLLSGILIVGLMFTYYGNERMNYFSTAEVKAFQYIYQKAPPDSLILTASFNVPGKVRNYEDYANRTLVSWDGLQSENPKRKELLELADIMTRGGHPAAYLMITRSQKEHLDLIGGTPGGVLDKLERALENSEQFETIFSNDDANVFVVTDASSLNKHFGAPQ